MTMLAVVKDLDFNLNPKFTDTPICAFEFGILVCADTRKGEFKWSSQHLEIEESIWCNRGVV